jgi:hypothetical protein
MNRRRFLTMLGVAPVAVKAAALLKVFPESNADYYRRMRAAIPVEKQSDLVGGWVSYKYKGTVTLPPTRDLRFTMRNCPRRELQA